MKAEVKMQVRLPAEIRDALELDAKNNQRSMNGQIIAVLKEHFIEAGLWPVPHPDVQSDRV
ncbi:Arc family DNA-binding protein [Paraburkholderia mimosarum]|uniref:Arc family DNA-binding protein n=1 Tax=Paraburkholderia mimosarum TaxID=312026 RepID=UPI0039C08FD7